MFVKKNQDKKKLRTYEMSNVRTNVHTNVRNVRTNVRTNV